MAKRLSRRKYLIGDGVYTHLTECVLLKACSKIKDLHIRNLANSLGLKYNSVWQQLKRTIKEKSGREDLSLYENREECLKELQDIYYTYPFIIDRLLINHGMLEEVEDGI